MKLLPFALATATLALTGCAGMQTVNGPAKLSLAGIQGKVFGGQQPIVGAAIQLYQAGSTGYGQGALALVPGQGVTTNATGGFTLTSTYQCTAGSQVYITSNGGNPGAGINNSAVLMAGLGLCDNLSSSTFISLNEVTTVGTVWALAPFMNGTNIGAPASNAAGLAQAFADISALVNTAIGYANSSTSGVTIPTAELYTLANILAACVNSTGAGDGGGCDSLFTNTTPSGGPLPSDTVSAAINMARNPGSNVTALLALSAPTAPFAPTISSANDLTVAVAYTGGGLSAPSGLAFDAAGDVWVTNSGNNSVTEFAHTGAILSGASGYTAGALNLPSAIAIDATGNAWVANAGNSTVTELSGTGSSLGIFTGGGLSTPTSINFDGLGNAWLANSGNNSVSELSSTGAALSPAGTGYQASGISAPVGVAINPR